MKTKNILVGLSIITASFIISGCGSSDNADSSSTVSTSSSTTSTSIISGQLADSYVENADYNCSDGTIGTTDIDGRFNCKELPVTFKLGGVELGTIKEMPNDKHVFPQDLVGVSRDDVNNSDVVAMAQFLQSCDKDNNTTNGIQVKEEIKEALENHHEELVANTVTTLATDLNLTLVSEDDAKAHLEHTKKFVDNVNKHSKDIPQSMQEVILSAPSTLTQEAKNTLSYMGNEERLAHDVYLNLYNYHLANGDEIKQLNNIGSSSEKTHIEIVQALVKKYITSPDEFTNIDSTELNYSQTPVEDMQMGTYDISSIQNLYDALYAKGIQSPQDALEVGCMVEVTDINDLTQKIAIAEDSNASDLVQAFEFLRDGSYSHYWAFDKGLKNMGITEGCCSIGEVNGVNYCHPEYPQDTQGSNGDNAKKDGPHDGSGQQKGRR